VALYLDSSAVVKLVMDEAGSSGLRDALAAVAEEVVTSDLTRTEVLRAAGRHPDRPIAAARAVLDRIGIISLPASVHDRAGLLAPEALRSLDAIHLAAALDLGDDLRAVVTYDERLGAAARALGVAVVAPM